MSSISIGSNPKLDDIESVIVEDENTPLIQNGLNPNSAIHYRSIKLPSSLLNRERKFSDRKIGKELFDASELATDIYADTRVAALMEKQSDIPHMELEASASDDI